MATIAERINKRLAVIKENVSDVSWKDPDNAGYDRQYAEDALFSTIGPMTENPRWSGQWVYKDQAPPPGFTPGGPAPQWTENEVVFAFAGDPLLMHRPNMKDHPRSPAYGNRGGAPLYRAARKVARQFRRERDPDLLNDLYQTGFVELTKFMKPGYDKSNANFIGYVQKAIEKSMVNGTSGAGEESIKAIGDVAKDSGLIGLQGLLKSKTPEDARKVAGQIKGKFQTGKNFDKHDDNPFGRYSSEVYRVANALADALESKDPQAIEQARMDVDNLSEKIKGDQDMVLGAGTGIAQAVTGNRETPIGISSMDMPLGQDGGGTMGDNLDNNSDWRKTSHVEQSDVNEAINFALKYALETDIGPIMQKNPEWQELAAGFGLKPGEALGGPLTAAEYRCVLRKIGYSASQFPGKGTMRKALNIPRDAKGWWTAGEDPEIEPIPAGGIWKSLWTRNGNDEMEDVEIMKEFTQEYKEFVKLGIKGVEARMKIAASGTGEVLSKVSIGKAKLSGMLKLKMAGHMNRERALGESMKRDLRKMGIPLIEDFDPIDRRLINEAFDFIIRKLTRSIVLESSGAERRQRIEEADAHGIIWTA